MQYCSFSGNSPAYYVMRECKTEYYVARGDFLFFSPNKLLITCNMYAQNKIIENIDFQLLSHRCRALWRYSDKTTLHSALFQYALSQLRKVIFSKRYRSWHIGTVIASKSYRSVQDRAVIVTKSYRSEDTA
jgi:hypothetical protein